MQPPALEPNKFVVVHDRTYLHHAEKQYNNLREQAKLLLRQAKEIKERVALANHIHRLSIPFKPVMFRHYSLYEHGLSMIGPSEWNHEHLGSFISFVRQLGDGTWEKVNNP